MKLKRYGRTKTIGFSAILIALIALVYFDFMPRTTHAEPPLAFQPEEQMISAAMYPDVEASKSISTTTLPSVCLNATGTNGEYSCFTSYYKDLVLTHGVDAAFADIKTRYNEVPFVADNCHPFMHIIGQAAFQLYPDISDAYLHGDSFCWSGYYHGILEGLAFKIGKTALPSQVNTVCADIPGKDSYSFEYYNCVHGLGHGIMELNDDDVPASLAVCDKLNGVWEEESCYSGVFMENIVSDSLDHDSKYLKTDDLLYPCDALADKYKSACYIGQTSYALEKTGHNFSKVSNLCASVDEPFRDVCFQSFGRDAAANPQNDPMKTKSLCQIPANATDTSNCVVGALKEMISYFHNDTQEKVFCNSLDEPDKDMCLSTGKEYYSLF